MNASHVSNIINIIILTISYVTISIILSSIIGKAVKKIIPHKVPIESQSTLRLLIEIYFNLIFITLVSYAIANLINLLPGMINMEISFGIIFGFILFYYQNDLRNKIDYVINQRTFFEPFSPSSTMLPQRLRRPKASPKLC